MQRGLIVRLGLVLAVTGLLAACQMPDVAPFSDATGSLRAGVVEAGTVAIDRVKRDGSAETASRLESIWKVRVLAANGLADYAFALAQVVQAGENSRQGVNRLSTALQALGSSLPGVGAPSQAVVALSSKIGEVAIKMVAIHTLSAALAEAHPAIEKIAEVLKADAQDLRFPYEQVYSDARDRIQDETYDKFASLRVRATEKESEILQRITDHLADGNVASDDAGAPMVTELESLRKVIAGANERLRPYDERTTALAKERADLELLLERVALGADRVVETHRALAQALRERRAPDWRQLVSEAQEIQKLVDQLRETRAKAHADDLVRGE